MPINLADLSPQQEVAAVYLGYYDRAADPFGFSFWSQTAYQDLLSTVQSEPEFAGASLVEQEEEVLARIAQDFARQPETKAEYSFFQTPSAATAGVFLNQVYLNLFNRPIDTGAGSGQEFWTPLLLDAVNNPATAAFSVGEIILEIIKGAQEPDKSIVMNKIEASIDWTENAAANGIGTTASNFVVQDVDTGEFNIIDQEAYDAARGVIDGVDETQQSVDDAKQETQDFIDDRNTPEETILELGSSDLAPGGTYEADTVILNLDTTPPSSMTVNAGLVIIKAQNEQGPNPLVVDTSNWDVDEITVEDSEVDVQVMDIQGTDLNVVDQIDPNVTTTFNFDQQAAAGETEFGLGIDEVFGSVEITAENGEALETVNLSIDDPTNVQSQVAALMVQGIETLNIAGGNAGNAFSILGALDAGLTTIDGSDADADLNLNISDSTEEVTMSGGSGDDFFMVGNTLGTGAAQDSFNGNAGRDTLHAEFTSTGNRKPISENIEKFELSFLADAKLDFEDVDDVDTIEIKEVSSSGSVGGGNGVEIQDMDSTVKDLLITGPVNENDGRWELSFDDLVDDENDFDELTITWQNNSDETQEIDEFFLDGAEKVTVVFDGEQEMQFEDAFDLGFNLFDDGDEVTEHLTIRNINDGDGIINATSLDASDNSNSTDLDGNEANTDAGGRSGMHETDRLETLTVETTDSGDLYLGVRTNQGGNNPDGDGGNNNGFSESECEELNGAFIADAQSLESISVTASTTGTIWMGGIGITDDEGPSDDDENALDDSEDLESAKPAVRLDTVSVVSAGADIRMGTIDGQTEGNSEGASVSEFTIKADDDAEIFLNHVDVEDIQTMTIEIDDDAVVKIGNGGRDSDSNDGNGFSRGLEMQEQGEILSVSGAGEFKSLWFAGEAFATMDFSGLTEDGVCVDFDDAQVGSTVEGTDQDDTFLASEGDDIINGNGGDDVIVGNEGDDIINGGSGDDVLFGGDGNDTIDGGSGDDLIVGGGNGAPGPVGDIMTGGAGNDVFYFDLSNPSSDDDTGKSTNANADNPNLIAQDFITDFNPGEDTIVFDVNEIPGGPDLNDGKDLECGCDERGHIGEYVQSGPISASSIFTQGNIDFMLDNINIAVFDGVQSGPGGVDMELLGTDAGNDVGIVLRVGDYNDDGVFNFNANGADLQLLLDEDGVFTPDTLGSNGGLAFGAAEYEVGLLGAADKVGSMDPSDFIFV